MVDSVSFINCNIQHIPGHPMRKNLRKSGFFRPAIRKAATFILAIPLMSCVSHNNNPPAKKPSPPKAQEKTMQFPYDSFLGAPGWTAPVTPECTFEGNDLHYRTSDGFVKLVSDVFEPDESMIGAGCKSRYAFILTGKRLLMIHGLNTPPPQGHGDELAYIKIDVDHILAKGLVAWTQSEENAFILTMDNELRTIFPDLQHDIYVQTVPFDVKGAGMTFFSGYVHIGTPAGDIYSVSPGGERDFSFKMPPVKEPAFSVKDDALLFGGSGSSRVVIRVGLDGTVQADEKKD